MKILRREITKTVLQSWARKEIKEFDQQSANWKYLGSITLYEVRFGSPVYYWKGRVTRVLVIDKKELHLNLEEQTTTFD